MTLDGLALKLFWQPSKAVAEMSDEIKSKTANLSMEMKQSIGETIIFQNHVLVERVLQCIKPKCGVP